MRWTKDIYTSIEKYYQKLHVFLYVILKYCIIIFIIAGPKYFLFSSAVHVESNHSNTFIHCNFINNQFHVQYIYKKKPCIEYNF